MHATAADRGWELERTGNGALRDQIVGHLKKAIASGEFPIGSRLPSQRELAQTFGVNRSTIIAAMEELAALGIVEGHGSAGTIIASDTWSLLLPNRGTWRERVMAGALQANTSIVQSINLHEFDESVIRLGTSELSPSIFPKNLWERTLRAVALDTTSLGYLEPLGDPKLREELAVHLKQRAITADPSEILITSGSLQGLQLIAACLLEPGTHMLVEEPTYARSLQVFPSAGMTLVGIDMDSQGLMPRALEQALPERTRTPRALYTIPTNHNPTGVTMGTARRHEIMEICLSRGVPIIEDDAYGELCLEGSAPAPLKAMDTTGSVIYLGSASKSFAAGLRVGWMVAPQAIIERLADAKMQSDYGASSVSQMAMAHLLASGEYDEYLQDLRKVLCKRRDHALAALERCLRQHAYWHHPNGGFFIWLTFRRSIPSAELFSRALEAGILLNPGDIYSFGKMNSLRLSYSYASLDEFAAGIERLADIVGDLSV